LREHWPELLLAGLICGTIFLAFLLPGDTPGAPETNVEPDAVVVTHTSVPEGEGSENAYRLCDFMDFPGCSP